MLFVNKSDQDISCKYFERIVEGSRRLGFTDYEKTSESENETIIENERRERSDFTKPGDFLFLFRALRLPISTRECVSKKNL